MNFSDYQQIPTPVVSHTIQPPLPPAQKHIGRWVVIILSLAAAAAIIVFLLALLSEVSRRDNELKNIIARAQQGASASIIENKLLTDLSGNFASSSPTIATDATFGLTAVSDRKDPTRQLAEKLNRPQLGNASSILVIVEFADFECAICEQEFPIIRTITNKYAKDILFIFRNYPVKDDNSGLLAQASLCAAEQGKFWSFHDRLYLNQGKITNNNDLKNLAAMAGVNWSKLEACVNSEKYRNQVLEDMSDALDLGVAGTPTFFINGTKLEGAVTADVWEQIIAKYKELNK